ncbi:hypothetical protein [Streptomyces aureus]|uniref:hypothetical protein n=1 Tax=Streptomyces aureus TaxID=193461 RepID=UPI0036AD3B4C
MRRIPTLRPDRLIRQPRDLEQLSHLADQHNVTPHGQANRRDPADPGQPVLAPCQAETPGQAQILTEINTGDFAGQQ